MEMRNTSFLKNKLSTITFVLNLLCFVSSAQTNLVPNGSFENYSTCPTISGGQINYATPWFQPNGGGGGSSDFFHTCSGHVPFFTTYQYPRTGNGFAGINLFHDTIAPSFYDWDREYIEVGLTDSLRSGKKYCIRFFANKGNWSMWAIKNIQAVLTNDSLLYNDVNYSYITGVTPIMEADSVITDTLSWIPVQTTYTAHGGEKFITIGNFSPGNMVIHRLVLPHGSSPNTLGYYVIDDVSIYEQPDVNAGNDTLIPPGDSVRLGITGRPDIFYSWSPATGLNNPNIANPMATPSISTIYVLTVTDTNSLACTNVFKDTVNVQVGYLGVNENSKAVSFNIYPNPAANSLTLTLSKGEGTVTVSITDICGKEIKQLETENKTTDIDISTLQDGIYFITAKNKNSSLKSTKKFVVLK